MRCESCLSDEPLTVELHQEFAVVIVHCPACGVGKEYAIGDCRCCGHPRCGLHGSDEAKGAVDETKQEQTNHHG